MLCVWGGGGGGGHSNADVSNIMSTSLLSCNNNRISTLLHPETSLAQTTFFCCNYLLCTVTRARSRSSGCVLNSIGGTSSSTGVMVHVMVTSPSVVSSANTQLLVSLTVEQETPSGILT